jgi:ABC-type multidrug transport system fused ATPase/permease subunit
MRTFPDADPGTPDIRGPWRFLLWLAARNWQALLLASGFNALWVAAQGISPGLIGAAVSDGLVARNEKALVWWGVAMLGSGVVQALAAMLADRSEVSVRIGSGYQTLQLVTRKACDLGATVGRRVSAGDLVTVGVSDISLAGQALEIGARGAGGAVGFVLVAVLMLTASWRVGLLVLIAVPVILLVTTRLSRLLRERQGQVRAQQRELTDQAVDIVRGLRVLRGLLARSGHAGRPGLRAAGAGAGAHCRRVHRR